MLRSVKSSRFRHFTIRYSLPALILCTLPLISGCGAGKHHTIEHDPWAMETGLMEVTVCAKTADDLLLPVTRSVASGEDYPLAALHLLRSTPENATLLAGYGLSAPLPENTDLSLSLTDGLLAIHIESGDDSAYLDTALASQSICSTALGLPGVTRVQLSIGSETVSVFPDDTANPKAGMPELNPLPLPVFSSGEKTVAAKLYYPLSDTPFFVPVTAYLPGHATIVSVAEALINTQPPTGLENPFPEDVLLLFAEETDDGLLLEFSEEIIKMARTDDEKLQSVLACLWHTLREVQPIQKLILSVGGYPIQAYIGSNTNQIP